MVLIHSYHIFWKLNKGSLFDQASIASILIDTVLTPLQAHYTVRDFLSNLIPQTSFTVLKLLGNTSFPRTPSDSLWKKELPEFLVPCFDRFKLKKTIKSQIFSSLSVLKISKLPNHTTTLANSISVLPWNEPDYFRKNYHHYATDLTFSPKSTHFSVSEGFASPMASLELNSNLAELFLGLESALSKLPPFDYNRFDKSEIQSQFRTLSENYESMN